MNSIYALIEDFIDELYKNGTVDRWKGEKATGKAGPCRYDRAAVMRSAWAYRKGDGLSMSAALKRAWADTRRAALRLVA